MTGYGEAAREVSGAHYFLEIRSLNAKYFKSVIRLPDEFQGLEPELEAALRKRLTRGTVTVSGACTDASASAAQTVNHEALASYIDQIRRAGPVQRGEAGVDVGSLLMLPGVLQAPANEEERIQTARGIYVDLLGKALDGVLAMRVREGETTRDDLVKHLNVISEKLESVTERAPLVVDEYQERLRARVDGMLKELGVSVEPADLVREVAVYAERSDIAEELTRLAAHVDQFRDIVSGEAEDPVGRTLDFVAQEMLREANTIASKCNDAQIARDIVVIKGAVDRIKEQVQNVE